MSIDEFIDGQPQNKKKKYLNVVAQQPRNTIDPLVKVELTRVDKYKAPRVVQARHASWLLAVGRFTKKLEHTVYARDRQRRWFNFAKGYTQKELANILVEKLNKFERPRIICYDHTSFDGHVTHEMTRRFFTFVARCFPDEYRTKISEFCRGQTYNKVKKYGLRFQYKGTVCSGDITTSFQDCLTNYCFLRAALADQNIKKYELLVNGDDSVVIIEASARFDTQRSLKFFRTCNMETKIEVDSTRVEDLEFCQLLLRNTAVGPMMVHKPERLQQRYGMTHRAYHMTRDDYQHALAYAYMHLYKQTGLESPFVELHTHYCINRDKCWTRFESVLNKDPDLAWLVKEGWERTSGPTLARLTLRDAEPYHVPIHVRTELSRYEVDHIRERHFAH